VIAAASMLVGNLLALLQSNIKRLLAYSSIAHMGYLLVAVIAVGVIGTPLAAESLLFYLAAYFVTTLTAFGVVTVLGSGGREAEELDDYQGLFWTRPWPAFALTAALLSLAGIPLTAGFVGKFYLLAAGSQGSLWTLLGVLVVGSGIGLYYYLRVVFQMARTTVGALLPAGVIPREANLALAVLLFLLLGLGVYPGGLIDLLVSRG
jgi:NADH-quinone oxidoreductase subunit N